MIEQAIEQAKDLVKCDNFLKKSILTLDGAQGSKVAGPRKFKKKCEKIRKILENGAGGRPHVYKK